MRYSKEKQQKDSDLFNEYIRRKNNKTNLKAYAKEFLSQVDRQSESAILWKIRISLMNIFEGKTTKRIGIKKHMRRS